MIIPYTACPLKVPVPGRIGKLTMPRPLAAVRITGPATSRLYDGLLDTGADDTTFDPMIASVIGVDLTRAPEREIHLMGRGNIRCRFATVTLQITDGVSETYEWDAMIAFAPFLLRRNLLGYGGFLQFFAANFRSNLEEVILFPNAAYAGRVF